MMATPAAARRASAIAVFFGAYVVFSLVFAPASLLDAALHEASNGRARLAEASGSLWSGSGQLEARDASGQRGIGRQVSWRFRPRSLLAGRLGFDVALGRSPKDFALHFSPSGLEMGDADFILPAATAAVALPQLLPLDPRGELLVHVSRLSITVDKVSGDVMVQWPNAGSSLTPVSPLGHYQLHIRDGPSGLHAALRTLAGPLHLEGDGAIGAGGHPKFRASARIDPERQAQLEPFLRLVAVERGDGVFELQLDQGAGSVAGNANAVTRQR